MQGPKCKTCGVMEFNHTCAGAIAPAPPPTKAKAKRKDTRKRGRAHWRAMKAKQRANNKPSTK